LGVGKSLTGEDPAMAWVDYDQLAAVYDRDRAVPLEALEPWRAALVAYLPPASGLPVLDLGAGTGLFSAAIAQWFDAAVVAVEPSEGMRRQARARRAHPRIAYVGGRGEQLPLRDSCCDSAWLSTVIHHLSDLAACAGELRRVVRPGGWVLIRNAFPDRPEPGTRLFTFWPGARAILARAPTVQATRATFGTAGFTFHRLEQICDQSAASLKEAYDRARVRADSLLRLLPDAEFTSGLEALERAAAAETTPTPVIRRLDLLVLQAPR
jgi:ubiquinone/menaquinone biosynthesis C-methylase UbiE